MTKVIPTLVTLALVALGVPAAAQDEPTSQPMDCATAGGECMEGCELGYRNAGSHGCFDSTCCVQPDQTSPAAVVGELFTAAQMNDFTSLAHLCDPSGGGDGDVQGICGLAADPSGGAEFVEYFAGGALAGEATIADDTATVPFTFGPAGSRSETMNLVRRDGKWYLQSF